MVQIGFGIHKFKAKGSKINAAPLCFGNVSKDVSTDNVKKTGLYRYVYDFRVDYDSIDEFINLEIYKYLMKKHDIKCLDLLKKMLIRFLSTFIIGNFGKSSFFNSKGPIQCMSLNNPPCKATPTLVNINSDEKIFFIYFLS